MHNMVEEAVGVVRLEISPVQEVMEPTDIWLFWLIINVTGFLSQYSAYEPQHHTCDKVCIVS